MRTWLLIVAAGAAGAACASKAPGQPGPDASFPSSGVFPPTTTELTLDVSGGLQPAPAAGSTCTPGIESYRYVLATRALSYSECTSPTAGGVYTMQAGQRTLDQPTANQLVAELNALALPPQACGSDVQATFVFTTPGGDQTTSNAACLIGFNDVEATLGTAAP